MIAYRSAAGLGNLGDDILRAILDFCITSQRDHGIRLVDKRFSTLSMPYLLHTVSVRSPAALGKLARAPNRPLLDPALSKYVKCLELCFNPSLSTVIWFGDLPTLCPNLTTVRFRFDLGIAGDALASGDELECLPSTNMDSDAPRLAFNASWLWFLSRFNPQKLEWISNELTLQFLRVHPDLRQLLDSWSSLSCIFLDGICLVDQEPGVPFWHISLLAKHVHIRAELTERVLLFLSCAGRIARSSTCQTMTLEARTVLGEYRPAIPISLLSKKTVVESIGWTPAQRNAFRKNMTRRPSLESNQRPEVTIPWWCLYLAISFVLTCWANHTTFHIGTNILKTADKALPVVSPALAIGLGQIRNDGVPRSGVSPIISLRDAGILSGSLHLLNNTSTILPHSGTSVPIFSVPMVPTPRPFTRDIPLLFDTSPGMGIRSSNQICPKLRSQTCPPRVLPLWSPFFGIPTSSVKLSMGWSPPLYGVSLRPDTSMTPGGNACLVYPSIPKATLLHPSRSQIQISRPPKAPPRHDTSRLLDPLSAMVTCPIHLSPISQTLPMQLRLSTPVNHTPLHLDASVGREIKVGGARLIPSTSGSSVDPKPTGARAQTITAPVTTATLPSNTRLNDTTLRLDIFLDPQSDEAYSLRVVPKFATRVEASRTALDQDPTATPEEPASYLTYYQTTSRGTWIITSSHTTYSVSTPVVVPTPTTVLSPLQAMESPFTYIFYYSTTSNGVEIVTSARTTYAPSVAYRTALHAPTPSVITPNLHVGTYPR